MAELRLMTKDDIKKCTEIYMSAFPKEGKLADCFRDWLPEYYEKYIGSEERMAYVLAEADTIIGLITAIVIPGIGNDSIHIDTVAIAADYQNKGYGTQMLNEFIKCSGGSLFSLSTTRGGNGYKLYNKAGFEDIKENAYMIMIPGVTDETKRLKAELEKRMAEIKQNKDILEQNQKMSEQSV